MNMLLAYQLVCATVQVLHVRDQMLNKFYHAGEECNRAALACVGALAAFDTAESFNIASGLDINPHNKTHSQVGAVLLSIRYEYSSFPSLPAEAFLENHLGFATLQLTVRYL